MEKAPYKIRKVLMTEAKQIIGLKQMAYKDYIAARNLLHGNFLHQAAFFINTSIEKELKANLIAKEISVNSTHETTKLLGIISKNNNENPDHWINEINTDFIKVVSKIYKSRYYETLGPGYNFVINRNKFLAELDYTYAVLESKTKFDGAGSVEYPSRYLESIESKNPMIYLNNYLLNNIPKKDFLDQPDMVYEFRIAESHHPLQCEYTIPKNIESDKFSYEGLKQTSNRSFTMSQWIDTEPKSVMISFVNSKF